MSSDSNCTTHAAEPSASEVTSAVAQRSRHGKVLISGFFERDKRENLKALSFVTDRTQEDLLGEALQLLFDKHAPQLQAVSALRQRPES